ncbi:aldo/keto reductase [Pelagicoccus mobilis]|uniref:Aldo/keto reductase n=1 Tax=Pelagicoccus mobilis TaxID=415221 RepID=A0A934RZT4_9BACT|nr:aldo/keto reductase [Pelagicoccus mobilis]MBK1876498.1 aldo/keto reductase [Pelagicoccus mobilis]
MRGNDKQERRAFVRKVVTGAVGVSLAPQILKGADAPRVGAASRAKPLAAEWRNRKAGMAYRMFGNTGMMVSEIVFGSSSWDDEDKYFDVLDLGLEKGINYIDVAPQYQRGQSERVVGRYLKERKVRDQFFVSSKISFYDEFMTELAEEILSGLPGEKRTEIEKRAAALIEERGVTKPGYHFQYFKAQDKKFLLAYIRHLVIQDYGRLKSWKPRIKKRMREIAEDSLSAMGLDYYDVLHCPHGVAMPEMLDDENIREFFEEFKAEGKMRFSAVSAHNDVAGILDRAIELGHYDGAMLAYNIGNHASLERSIQKAKAIGMGIVAMKVARVLTVDWAPKWLTSKLNTTISEDVSLHAKTYLWALQNPDISCCVSEMMTREMVADNSSIVGRKVELKKV